jgi:hypothetical protein
MAWFTSAHHDNGTSAFRNATALSRCLRTRIPSQPWTLLNGTLSFPSLWLGAVSLHAAAFPGASDHPLVKRVTGSEIFSTSTKPSII